MSERRSISCNERPSHKRAPDVSRRQRSGGSFEPLGRIDRLGVARQPPLADYRFLALSHLLLVSRHIHAGK
jgi:hypothetical protein